MQFIQDLFLTLALTPIIEKLLIRHQEVRRLRTIALLILNKLSVSVSFFFSIFFWTGQWQKDVCAPSKLKVDLLYSTGTGWLTFLPWALQGAAEGNAWLLPTVVLCADASPARLFVCCPLLSTENLRKCGSGDRGNETINREETGWVLRGFFFLFASPSSNNLLGFCQLSSHALLSMLVTAGVEEKGSGSTAARLLSKESRNTTTYCVGVGIYLCTLPGCAMVKQGQHWSALLEQRMRPWEEEN